MKTHKHYIMIELVDGSIEGVYVYHNINVLKTILEKSYNEIKDKCLKEKTYIESHIDNDKTYACIYDMNCNKVEFLTYEANTNLIEFNEDNDSIENLEKKYFLKEQLKRVFEISKLYRS